MDDQNRAREALRQAPGGAGDIAPAAVSANPGDVSETLAADGEALARLTAALRAGLAGSGQGRDLIASQMPADADPFEFFGSGIQPQPVRHIQDLPREDLSSAAGMLERRVALMAQDMAAFGVVGREAPLRLDPPGEALRHEYFA